MFNRPIKMLINTISFQMALGCTGSFRDPPQSVHKLEINVDLIGTEFLFTVVNPCLGYHCTFSWVHFPQSCPLGTTNFGQFQG